MSCQVAAGAIAEKWLAERFGVSIVAWVSAVGDVLCPRDVELRPPSRAEVDASTVRCPHTEAAARMTQLITEAKQQQDSVGGVVTCAITNVPLGLGHTQRTHRDTERERERGREWRDTAEIAGAHCPLTAPFDLCVVLSGEPVFDKLEALFAHAMLSIPATKGFEIGSGFDGTRMRGSQHNDPFTAAEVAAATAAAATAALDSSPSPPTAHTADAIHAQGNYTGRHLRTSTNHSGGIQGGISNGQDIVFRVAFKPPATIGQSQQTADFSGAPSTLTAEGRHDPCVVPRAVPIVEAMAALVLADAAMMQQSRIGASRQYQIIGKVNPKLAVANNGTFPA